MPEKKAGGYSGYTDARKAANAKYEAHKVERISLVLQKGKKSEIKSAAAGAGESVNAYINRAIDERMDKMYKVISQLNAGEYIALQLDRKIIVRNYNALRCDGEIYEVVPCYGLNDIAIKAQGNFVGKTIELIGLCLT